MNKQMKNVSCILRVAVMFFCTMFLCGRGTSYGRLTMKLCGAYTLQGFFISSTNFLFPPCI